MAYRIPLKGTAALIAGAAFLALATAPGAALAQKGGATPPPVPNGKGGGTNAAVDFLTDAVTTCDSATDSLDEANDLLTSDGWAIDYLEENGPYIYELSASKAYGDLTAYYYATMEGYPTAGVGYCSYEVDTPPDIDLNAMTSMGFNGDSQQTEAGTYGSWDTTDQDTGITYYISAYVTPDLFHIQATWVVPQIGD